MNYGMIKYFSFWAIKISYHLLRLGCQRVRSKQNTTVIAKLKNKRLESKPRNHIETLEISDTFEST
jgi:hypothetical protein